MRVRIRLDTLSDITNFVKSINGVAEEVTLTDSNKLRVSGKSLIGAIYTMEWDKIYCECDKDIYSQIKDYVIEE